MIYRILGVLLLACLGATQASAKTEKHRWLPAGYYDESGKRYSAEVRAQRKKELRELATAICANYSVAGLKIAEQSKDDIILTMKTLNGTTHPSGADILLFLNKNKDDMICSDGNGNYMNYMMMAFERGAEASLFKTLFIRGLMPKDKSVRPDVNVVSFTGAGGSPQTLLDYVDEVIRTHKFGEGVSRSAKGLRRMFIKHFHAKRFTELPAAEQRYWLQRGSLR